MATNKKNAIKYSTHILPLVKQTTISLNFSKLTSLSLLYIHSYRLSVSEKI